MLSFVIDIIYRFSVTEVSSRIAWLHDFDSVGMSVLEAERVISHYYSLLLSLRIISTYRKNQGNQSGADIVSIL